MVEVDGPDDVVVDVDGPDDVDVVEMDTTAPDSDV